MAECGGGAKRKEGEHSEVCSVDDVAEWFARQVDNGGCGKVSAEHRAKILQAVGEHEVDREVLASSRSPLLAEKQKGGCPPPKANSDPARRAIVS